MKKMFAAVALLVAFLALPLPATAQAEAPGTASTFDPAAATQAYLARMTAEQRASSNAYFEGKYWLILWDTVVAILVAALLLEARWSARMRDFGERLTRRKPLQTAIYTVQYLLLVALLVLPWTAYENHFREHQYGLSNLSLGGWLREHAIGVGVQLLLMIPVVILIYGGIRRAPKTWHWWATAIAIVC